MPASPHSTTQSRGPRLVATILTAIAPLLVSCASPGPPRPPSLHLTDVVTDLTAQRVGDQVLLHWTTPARTTDGFAAPVPLTAEICRDSKPASPAKQSSAAATCGTVLYVAVTPGPSQAADLLPATLTSDPVLLLAYRIRILNPEGRSAGLSRPAFAPAGTTPPPVAGLRALASRSGITLEWQTKPSLSLVELERTLASTTEPKPSPKKSSTPQFASPSEPTEVRLRTGDEAHSTDPGGTLDRTAQRGQTYTYRAQRIRTITSGGHTYELRSEPSAPVTLSLSDTFPPATPTGLAAVPSSNGNATTIDLSWQPNTDPDLAGYHVYRRTASGSFERLTSTPVLGPAFSDKAVSTGTPYTYRVTAIDNTGNESAPSTEITETARPQTP